MPSFTSHLPSLQAVGPVVDIRVAVGTAAEAAMRTASAAIPLPITAAAMIDTGATGSVVRQGMSSQLGLNPVGITYIEAGSIYIDGKPVGVNVKQRYRALRPRVSRR